MNCDETIDLYDDFRDQTLAPTDEKTMIKHLEGCTTCSMDFEMRDSALGALQDSSAFYPPMSDMASEKIRLITRKKSPVFFKGLSMALAVACLLLIYVQPPVDGTIKAAPDTTALLELKTEINRLETKNVLLIGKMAMAHKTIADLKGLENNQKKMLAELAKIGITGDEVLEIVNSIDSELKQVHVVLQKGGGQATIFAGKGWEENKKHNLVRTHQQEEVVGFVQRVKDLGFSFEGLN
jgi:hypothetical protein